MNRKNNTYLPIIITCHKYDFFLTKLCVSSIRYFYPNVQIFLIKDYLYDDFSTKILEKYFHVKILDLGIRKYGWGTAKIHIILSKKLKRKKYLLLDSDVVFIGKVLDVLRDDGRSDFIISPEFHHQPKSQNFNKFYYDINWVKTTYPKWHYPGYTFNTGQIVITPGIFTQDEFAPYISIGRYPHWTSISKKYLPTRDQSLLNILIPKLIHEKIISVKTIPFMRWSESEFVRKSIKIRDVKEAFYPMIIHWAGMSNRGKIQRMTRRDILLFFYLQYYLHIFLTFIRLKWDFLTTD